MTISLLNLTINRIEQQRSTKALKLEFVWLSRLIIISRFLKSLCVSNNTQITNENIKDTNMEDSIFPLFLTFLFLEYNRLINQKSVFFTFREIVVLKFHSGRRVLWIQSYFPEERGKKPERKGVKSWDAQKKKKKKGKSLWNRKNGGFL